MKNGPHRISIRPLLAIVREHAAASARELDGIVFRKLEEFTHGPDQNDDIAALILEFH